jgi:uncharacterized protein (TIGR03437 family)
MIFPSVAGNVRNAGKWWFSNCLVPNVHRPVSLSDNEVDRKHKGWQFIKSLFDMYKSNYFRWRINGWALGACWFLMAGVCHAQLASSAYRVLGQTDLQQNGLNMVTGAGLNDPIGVALDARGGQVHVYISDAQNSRVLGWADLNAYQIGDPPAIVLGQPNPQYSAALGIGSKGLTNPLGVAVDPTTGNLFVADFGDNRVVRFPSPFANPSRIEPDAVYGQASFTAVATGLSSSALSGPRSVTCDTAGNLWVSDSGNNRILRFPASTLNSPAPVAADTVIGQPDFVSGAANLGATISASGLNTPTGLAFDSQGNLYVADFGNTRVLRFPAPLGPSNPNATATGVWGESNFATRSTGQQPSATSMAGPLGVAVDNSGNLYVAIPTDNRVLVFPTNTPVGAAATSVYGQSSFTLNTANAGVAPLASASSLASPADVKIDASGNVLVTDSANNRVVEFPSGSKNASRVWGQTDFTSNGPNRIKPGSIDAPFKMAIDYSAAPFALYVSDTSNNRVLIWKDSVHFQNGDPADLVIGQPSLLTSAPNVDSPNSKSPSATSVSGPTGLAINPSDGTLYVADFHNNRVLRYPRPVAQSGRITPDAVIGQADFVSSTSAAVNASSLNEPAGLAIGPNGDLFVADLGNNRVLEFAVGAGNGASAIRVYGQPNMFSSVKPSQVSAQTLNGPQGISVDAASNLYVADSGANRVLAFPNTSVAPAAGAVATFVLGQLSFSASSGGTFRTPVDVAVDSSGDIFVADANDNRVLTYPSLVFLPPTGAAASGVLGQSTPTGTTANWDSPGNGLASADSFYSPGGLYVDRQDTLYVGDVGNNRVLQFLKPGVVVNAATYQAGVPVAQGSLAVMFGTGLAAAVAQSSNPPWAPTLENRQITIDDQTVSPIYYLSQTQANFQIPSNAALGTQRVALRVGDTGELVAGGSLLISAASPGLFSTNQSGSGQGAVVNQDNTINSATNPAPVGSTVTLYGTGQGPVSPAVQDGAAAATSPLSYTVAVPTSNSTTCFISQPSMCVAVGSNFGNVQYSGLAPGFVGLWQINVTIPQGTPAGSAVGVRVVIDSTSSNLVTIAVK